ncbi:carbohydrate ABC transporter permease [Paenibacillus aceris]|uniref:Aldouronate transport system permease protein n=1 Tax=Paenibacillus aceris TaxID=869555 RepID=A0ABS4HXM6_9BACL|nr:carbohydrate ABC transporter permease [Paenibacillus aceris]MBP1963308.1 putative aldouronate transport system permease protein [Paenibacillus aceris]NHW36185.1 carbohydrate ABC transporter permease [Paenibacillus aceris]
MPTTNVTNHEAFSRGWNIFWNMIIILLVLTCITPLVFTIVISLTSEKMLGLNGYSFWPQQLSVSSYTYLFKDSGEMLNSFFITFLVTVIGVISSLLFILPYAYAISRPEFAYRHFFTFLAFFTMLFQAGIVPFYMVITQLLHLKDTIWALILPLSVNTFYIIVMRTFYKTTISEGMIEAARIDGAGEFTILLKTVLPISLPGIATIGLFSALGYWNDWFNAMLFIDKPNLMTLQYLLIKIQNNLQYLLDNTNTLNAIAVAEELPQESTRMAMVVVATLPIVLAYPFFQRFFIKGLTVGSVKG